MVLGVKGGKKNKEWHWLKGRGLHAVNCWGGAGGGVGWGPCGGVNVVTSEKEFCWKKSRTPISEC